MHSTTVVAVLGLAVLANGHMIMNTPVPYGKSTLNNSPLAADGSDYPCKQRTGVYDAEGANNTMALGSTQKLAFTGSATHGGGSCQVSITYDQNPTKSSTFKVIHSIEGGCPIRGVAGNTGDDANAIDPDTYNFTVPTSLPTGSATLAWTWFNKIGNREMYMNCAPITLTGSSSSKRSDEDAAAQNDTQIVKRDTAAYDALPNVFLANIGNGCITVDSTDVLFPDPGDSVEEDGLATSSALSTPTGSGCAKAVAPSVSPTAVGAGATVATSPAAASVPPVATSTSEVAPTSPQVTTTTAAAAVQGSSTSNPEQGGVFATVVSPAAASATGETSTPAASPVATAAATGTDSPSSSTGSSSSGGLSGPCTSEGMYNCIGGTSFQQCASGAWSVVQSVAAGTTCTEGQSSSLKIAAVARRRRSMRFSAPNKRR